MECPRKFHSNSIQVLLPRFFSISVCFLLSLRCFVCAPFSASGFFFYFVYGCAVAYGSAVTLAFALRLRFLSASVLSLSASLRALSVSSVLFLSVSLPGPLLCVFASVLVCVCLSLSVCHAVLAPFVLSVLSERQVRVGGLVCVRGCSTSI